MRLIGQNFEAERIGLELLFTLAVIADRTVHGRLEAKPHGCNTTRKNGSCHARRDNIDAFNFGVLAFHYFFLHQPLYNRHSDVLILSKCRVICSAIDNAPDIRGESRAR